MTHAPCAEAANAAFFHKLESALFDASGQPTVADMAERTIVWMGDHNTVINPHTDAARRTGETVADYTAHCATAHTGADAMLRLQGKLNTVDAFRARHGADKCEYTHTETAHGRARRIDLRPTSPLVVRKAINLFQKL